MTRRCNLESWGCEDMLDEREKEREISVCGYALVGPTMCLVVPLPPPITLSLSLH